MKLSIARSELVDALGVASKGMSARSTLPILSGIMLSCSEGEVTLQSTDLEVSVRLVVPALVEEPGETVIPGKLLTDIVRTLPEAAVSIETDGDIAVIRCQQSSFTIKTLNPADFPKFPEVSVEKSVELPMKLVSSMVRKVSKAISRDETRAILTGVLVSIDGPAMKMVATDSYRLAVSEIVLSETPADGIEAVVPGKALEEVSRIIAGTETVRMGTSENQIVFESEGITFITRRIEGTFPNYKQLLPKETQTTVTIATEDFTEAVKRVSLLALHNTPLKLSISQEDQTLSLSAATQDVGDASEDLMVKVDGEDVEIAFNHTFLMDGLVSTSADTVSLEIQNALKPGLMKSHDEDDFVYLLMPVRLG